MSLSWIYISSASQTMLEHQPLGQAAPASEWNKSATERGAYKNLQEVCPLHQKGTGQVNTNSLSQRTGKPCRCMFTTWHLLPSSFIFTGPANSSILVADPMAIPTNFSGTMQLSSSYAVRGLGIKITFIKHTLIKNYRWCQHTIFHPFLVLPDTPWEWALTVFGMTHLHTCKQIHSSSYGNVL